MQDHLKQPNQEAMSRRLQACYSGVVHDIMRAMGLKHFTLPPEMRPLLPHLALAGPAFTIQGKVQSGCDPHETLMAWTALLSQAPAGCIWTSQPNDREVAHMGELSGETLKNKGVKGCVTDGFIRDTNFLIDIGFQCWSRGYTPRDIVSHWLPDATQVEIRIGEVDIAPGDYLLGDRDGMVRIPQSKIEEVIEASEEAMNKESLVRQAILQGVDPQEAYLKFGKF